MGVLLSLEFPRAPHLSVGEFPLATDKVHTQGDIPHQCFFVNAMALSERVAVKKYIPAHQPCIGGGKQVKAAEKIAP